MARSCVGILERPIPDFHLMEPAKAPVHINLGRGDSRGTGYETFQLHLSTGNHDC
jgi:hypothetical protein